MSVELTSQPRILSTVKTSFNMEPLPSDAVRLPRAERRNSRSPPGSRMVWTGPKSTGTGSEKESQAEKENGVSSPREERLTPTSSTGYFSIKTAFIAFPRKKIYKWTIICPIGSFNTGALRA